MSGEAHLWQSVLLAGLADATEDRPVTLRRADIDWIAGNTKSFRTVCSLAGVNAQSVRESFLAGRICSDTLRAGGQGTSGDKAGDMELLRQSRREVVAWLKRKGPATVTQIRAGVKGNAIRTRAAVMLALQEGAVNIHGHCDYVTVYEAA